MWNDIVLVTFIVIIVPFSHYVGSAHHVLFFHSLLSLVISMLNPFIFMSSLTQSIHVFLDRSLLGCPSTFIVITLFVMRLSSVRITCPYHIAHAPLLRPISDYSYHFRSNFTLSRCDLLWKLFGTASGKISRTVIIPIIYYISISHFVLFYQLLIS
jgi:hypothetical protein